MTIMVTGALLLLELAFGVIASFQRGWPGGWAQMLALLAGMVGSAGFYLPVGVLSAGVQLGTRSREAGPGRGRREPWRPGFVLTAVVAVSALSFVLSAFTGPHLQHQAFQVMISQVDPATTSRSTVTALRDTEANDWFYLRALAAERLVEGEADAWSPDVSSDPEEAEAQARLAESRRNAVREARAIVSETHLWIGWAIMAGLMLPIGLTVGHTGPRFSGRSGRVAPWAMAAGVVVAILSSHLVVWPFVGSGVVPALPLLYWAPVFLPSVILASLLWAGATAARRPV